MKTWPELPRGGSAADRGPILRLGSEDAVWTLNPASAAAAHRFDRFVRDLPNQLRSVRPQVGLLLCLLAYDCIITKVDLIAAAQATSAASSAMGHRVVWTSKHEGYSHLEARCLSTRSRLHARRLPAPVDWSVAFKVLENLLWSSYPETATLAPDSALDLALTDARSWCYLHLPLCLYSHIRGAVRMPILSEEVLHRLFESNTRQVALPSACDAILSSAQDLSWDNQHGVSTTAATALPEGAISLITSIFSVSKNQSGLRLATYLNARELRDKLSLAVEMISAENRVAAVLMSWAFHLLTVGSIRKENPAVSTLAAYVGALLRPLARALCERKFPPYFYSQDDWSELFDFLRENGSSGQSAAALASIHQWAVQTYGCDPMPELIFQQVESTRIHANVIWPHELQGALERAAWVSDDERTNHQVQVLLALGGGGLFRIGDLLSLTTGDIQVCDDGLRIHVNPGHGIHAGKSRSARRIVRIGDPALINLIKRWRDRRRLETGESSEVDSLLFGDPHDQHKLYRMGQCVRLVNQLLKAATADDRVSFHTLRHSVATSRLYALLAHKQPPKAVSPLDELCHEMGHAGRETIWMIYFHGPEFALRAAVDRIPAVGIVHLEEAAFWLEMTPAAMRQRAHRASSGKDPAQSFYSMWLAEMADAVYPKLPEPGELTFLTAKFGHVGGVKTFV